MSHPNQPNDSCPCHGRCPRSGDCQACQAYHHAKGGKTSCGK